MPNQFDLSARFPSASEVIESTRLVNKGGTHKLDIAAGPLHLSDGVGINGNNLQTEHTISLNYGIGKSVKSNSSSIGISGLTSSQFKSSSLFGITSTEKSSASVSLHDIKMSGSWEVGGHTLIDYNLSASTCCAPMKQFFRSGFNWMAKGFNAGKALFNTVWGGLKTLPWAKLGHGIATAAQFIGRIILK
jgi:hypothetical protein